MITIGDEAATAAEPVIGKLTGQLVRESASCQREFHGDAFGLGLKPQEPGIAARGAPSWSFRLDKPNRDIRLGQEIDRRGTCDASADNQRIGRYHGRWSALSRSASRS